MGIQVIDIDKIKNIPIDELHLFLDLHDECMRLIRDQMYEQACVIRDKENDLLIKWGLPKSIGGRTLITKELLREVKLCELLD